MGSTHIRLWRSVVAVSAVLVMAGLVSSCAATPRAVLNVPGNYVADMTQPTIESPSGGPTATVLVCLDAPSAVHFETGDGGDRSVGMFKLDWQGSAFTAGNGHAPAVLETPVLAAGCGTLTFTVECCHVPHLLAVKAWKI